MLPLIVQVEKTKEQVADTFAFRKSPVRIGRNQLNDLQLDEPFVSQWHAVIRFGESGTSFLDLGATNKTLVNGRPIERNVEVAIDENTDIRIGSLRLHVLRTEAPAELFGRKRKSAFRSTASGGQASEGSVGSERPMADPPTMMLSPAALNATIVGKLQPPRASSERDRPSTPAAAASANPINGSSRPARSVEAAYRALEEQRNAFRQAVEHELAALPAAERAERLAAYRLRFPELDGSRAPAAALRTSAPHGHLDMAGWLQRLTGGALDADKASLPVESAMERVGGILEVFAHAFVELRRAQEQFCEEMAIERYADDSLLQTTEDPRALLAYLLTAEREGGARLNELSRALADFALHQVALISAAAEGGRRLVEILAPNTLSDAADPPSDSPALTHHRALARLWPRSARKLWYRYLAHHFDLADSDRFLRELFGQDFARRYYAVTGGVPSK